MLFSTNHLRFSIHRLLIACLLMGSHACLLNAQSSTVRYPLIPYPQQLEAVKGSFVIGPATTLQLPGNNIFQVETGQLQLLIKQATGRKLLISNTKAGNVIVLKQDESLTGNEAYQLDISPAKIVLSAKTPVGMFRAIQTIRQLMPASAETAPKTGAATIAIPAVKITDFAAYGWRGMHLDVSRHFFSVAYLKKFIDVLALYKMNKLHLHLTDDQGWRIEIKKYPLLTEKGAWREFDKNDSACMMAAKTNPDMAIDKEHIIQRDGKTLYGGYYTQAQMKDVIAYALAKQVEIIPEIDMPGHMMAAIAQYPYLSCPGGVKWGALFSTPLCPCNESTYEFAENVFSEIAALFSSEYMHLGADEVDKSTWKDMPACKAVMDANGFTSVEELQSYFVKRMEQFFNSKGKKLIGWDEILEGGISPTATLMYWRSWVPSAPLHAAKNGNHVIMTPGNPLYFDNAPDRNSIYNVYHFNPVPAGLTEAEAGYIIGAQANLWTENIPSVNRVEFMYMPRMTALSERLWTNGHDYESYLQRLTAHFSRLDKLKINYRIPDLDGFAQENVITGNKAVVSISKPIPGLTIRYTTDSSLPVTTSSLLPGNFAVTKNTQLKTAAFNAAGHRGEIYTLNYKRMPYLPAVGVQATGDGLQYQYFDGSYRSVELLTGSTETSTITPGVVVPAGTGKEGNAFGAIFSGYLQVPATGIYTFFLTADDGANLYLNDEKIIDNDGWHAPQQKSAEAPLEKGLHPFKIKFVEGGGGYTLKLEYRVNGGKILPVPEEWFKH